MKIPPEQRHVIVAMKEDGESVKNIAAHFGMTTDQVHYIIAKETKKERKQRVERPDDDSLYELYILENLKQKEIASRFNVSNATVSSWLKQAGIEKEWKHLQISEEDIRKYEAGKHTANTLAEAYDVDSNQMRYILSKSGVRKRVFPKRRHEYKAKRLREKRSQGVVMGETHRR